MRITESHLKSDALALKHRWRLIAVCLLFCGCVPAAAPVAETPLPPLVRTAEVPQASSTEVRSFPGIAKEAKRINLSFRIPGKLINFDVSVGERIAKDAVVAKLDPRDYKLAVQRFDAEYTAAKTALETADANLKRLTALLADDVASQTQFDAAKVQFETAKGKTEALTAQINAAKNALSDTELKAPFDGIAAERFAESGENVAAGIAVLSFYDVSHIDMAVNVPEELLIRFKDIRNYYVEFETFPGKKFPAALKEFGLAIQPGKQSYPMEVRVDLPKDSSVFPGMTAMVHIGMQRPKLTQRVPLSALFGGDEATALWTLENGKTVRRDVKVVSIIGSEAEIEAVLEPQAKIVIAGARSLHAGQTVREN
ncbi:MAG: efflux RND transporter periplasmic adaptor subunit [Planctomycetaceae bacterium]|jgi:RND family efflux transporter MFP subunit|nr:efflux RND transporter periplasmic adaptor subunit [Planctomycetaceae bacterium]